MAQEKKTDKKVKEANKPKKLDDKIKERKDRDIPPTKVLIRRLPPSLTEENFLEQISPIPDHDYFQYVRGDMSLGAGAFCRAYISFKNPDDIVIFKEKFDGYVFLDAKGNEYTALVEFAPYQKIPKKKVKKPDSRKGTIEKDPDYTKFLETLNEPEPTEGPPPIEVLLEEIEARERELKANHGCPKVSTPLIDYISKRKEEKKMAILKAREDRKKKEIERRKQREDERRKRRDKERELEKERQRQKQKEKDREKERERSKEDKESKGDSSQPVKLLKNPEREKDKYKKADDSGKGAREKSAPKDSRSKGARESERDKQREKERSSAGKRDGNKRPELKQERESSSKGDARGNPRYGGKGRDSGRDGDREDRDQGGRDRNRGGRGRDRDYDKPKDKPARDGGKDRKEELKDRKEDSTKPSKSAPLSKPKDKETESRTSKGDNVEQDADRPVKDAGKESERDAGKEAVKDSGKESSRDAGKEAVKNSGTDAGTVRKEDRLKDDGDCDLAAGDGTDQGETPRDRERTKDRERKRPRYKDRPERAIYNPGARAAERRKEQEAKKTGQGDAQSDSGSKKST